MGDSVENKVKADSIGEVKFKSEKTSGSNVNSKYIGEFHSNDTYIIGADPKSDKEKGFSDPTRKYYPSASKPELIKSKILKKHFEELQNNRIITIQSVSPGLVSWAASSLINCINSKKSYKCRTLDFKEQNNDSDSFGFEIFENDRVVKKGSRIFLVDLIEVPSAVTFLKNLFNDSRLGEPRKKELKKKDVYIICMFSSPELRQLFEANRHIYYFSEWYLDFGDYTKPLLQEIFSKQDAKDIYNDIVKQQSFWVYGANKEEQDETLSKLLSKGDQGEIQRIVFGNVEKVRLLEESGEKHVKRITPLDLIGRSPVAKELLYVAAFFPNLHLREFQYIVSFILLGKECEIDIEEEIITKKGKKKVIKRKEAVSSLAYFQKYPDLIFEKVHLEEIRGEKTTVVDFTKSYLRDEVKTYFKSKQPYYSHQQFLDIIGNNVLFKEDASTQMISNIVKLVAETALSDPDHYGTSLLEEIGLGRSKTINSNTTGETELEGATAEKTEKQEIIDALLAFIAKERQLDRLAALITELLEHEQLKKMVDDFFGSLIQLWKTPEILLSLLGRLRFNKNLDQLFWLKRMFNELADEKVELKKKVNEHFIRIGKQTNVDIYEHLEKIKPWWPKKINTGKIRKHNLYGLAFLYNYSISSVYTLPNEKYGAFPSNYFLFTQFHDKSVMEINRKVKYLIKWLFHPKLAGFSYNHSFTFHIDNINSNADLIEHWALILLGRSRKKRNPEGKRVLRIIVHQVYKYTDRNTRKNLRSVWLQKKQYYLVLNANQPLHKRKEKRLLTDRRDILIKILKYFDNN